MQKQFRLNFDKCLWIRSGIMDRSSIFRSLRKVLLERNVAILTLNGPDDLEGLERIRKTVWSSDTHVVMDCIMPQELKRLYPVFKDRKNFSMSLVDWWNSRHWFTRNADYVIFRNYNGIAVRRGLGTFAAGRTPPLLSWPDKMVPYAIAACALRLPMLLASPLFQLWHNRLRQLEAIPPERLLYFPFTIAEEHVPLKAETPLYDFCNVSCNGGYWFMRDPHASPRLNFGTLYHDRQRLTDLITQSGSGIYKVFNLGRSKYLQWDEYCRVLRGSRFAIATGGLHQNSVAKYTEFACLGIPMIGEDIPFEYPWLTQCLYPVDALNVTPEQLASQLGEAMALQPKLRENCLNVRDSLLKLYNAHQVLDMLQAQADGKPIPPGYLKPENHGGLAKQN